VEVSWAHCASWSKLWERCMEPQSNPTMRMVSGHRMRVQS